MQGIESTHRSRDGAQTYAEISGGLQLRRDGDGTWIRAWRRHNSSRCRARGALLRRPAILSVAYERTAGRKSVLASAEILFDKDDKLILCIQSYIVRTPHHVILIDPCVGNHKPRPALPFWNMMNSDRYESNLAATGLTVDDVDFVMCTHLHSDHVGWNTRLENGRWVPTFPKARYLFADRELEYWAERQKKDPASCPAIAEFGLSPDRRGKPGRGSEE